MRPLNDMGKCSQNIKRKNFLLSSIYNRSQFHRKIKYAYALIEQGCIRNLQWLLLVVVLCVAVILHLFSSLSKMSVFCDGKNMMLKHLNYMTPLYVYFKNC